MSHAAFGTAQRRVAVYSLLLLATAALLNACLERPEYATTGLALRGVEVPKVEAASASRAARPLHAVDDHREGSRLLLARGASHRLALAADVDAGAIRIIDADKRKELGHTALGGKPEQMVVGGDGRLYVALRDQDELLALELADDDTPTLAIQRRVPTGNEPVALAVTPDRQRLMLTAGWGRTLSGYDVGTLRARFTQPVEREPRGVTVSADGRYAFVAHAVGSTITRVDIRDIETTTKRLSAVKSLKLAGHDYLPRRRRTFGCFGFGDPLSHHGLLSRGTSRAGGSNEHQRFAVQGFALASLDDRVALPLVLSHRGEAVSGGYGGGDMRSYPAHQPALVTWKIGSESPHIRVAHTSFPASTSRGHFAGRGGTGCMLPRAATLDARRDELLVSCLGIDEVRAYALNDAGSGPTSLRRSLRGRWKVGPGTFGIASDSSTGEVFAYSQFDKALSVIQRATPRTDERPGERPVAVDAGEDVMLSRSYPLAPLEGGSVDARFDRGRRLFHASGDARISNDGRACASCHPDGRDDGLTWPSPNGPRQTPMLAGRLEGTAPYGWVGEEQTIEGHLKHTFERLGGRGLGGAELDALVHYVRSLPVPKPRATAPDATLVARGRELFHADTVGCGTCHTQGGIGSDGSNHEVGSGPKLDTPSLRFIAGTAPYFHDGRYRTLGELLRQTQGTMGWGGELSDNDLQALEAYMRTL